MRIEVWANSWFNFKIQLTSRRLLASLFSISNRSWDILASVLFNFVDNNIRLFFCVCVGFLLLVPGIYQPHTAIWLRWWAICRIQNMQEAQGNQLYFLFFNLRTSTDAHTNRKLLYRKFAYADAASIIQHNEHQLILLYRNRILLEMLVIFLYYPQRGS